MANELKQITSSFYTVQEAASTADGDISTGTAHAIDGTSLTATEQMYPLLDFKLTVSSGTPSENGIVEIYMQPAADGTNAAPAPGPAATPTYYPNYVGSFILDNTAATTYYYYFGAPNVDKEAKYYLYNKDGAQTLTLALAARTRTYGPV